MIIQDVINLSSNGFQVFVSNLLEGQRYKVRHFAPPRADIGIDIIASDEREYIAIQVKKYVNRKVNISMFYHTYGAAAY